VGDDSLYDTQNLNTNNVDHQRFMSTYQSGNNTLLDGGNRIVIECFVDMG